MVTQEVAAIRPRPPHRCGRFIPALLYSQRSEHRLSINVLWNECAAGSGEKPGDTKYGRKEEVGGWGGKGGKAMLETQY